MRRIYMLLICCLTVLVAAKAQVPFQRILWDFQTGGYITANPISFFVDGKQHIAIAAGQGMFVFALQ